MKWRRHPKTLLPSYEALEFTVELDLTYHGAGELGLLMLNILFQHLVMNFIDSDILSQ